MPSQTWENAMTIPKVISAAMVALAAVSSAALAQQARNGTITELNRLNSTISIRPTQSGTVGANAASTTEVFKVQGGISLETLHAGDRVSFSTSGEDDAKTITKIERSTGVP
jgi:Cu/Ag efflux protein CusF